MKNIPKIYNNISGNVAIFIALLTPVMLASGAAGLETIEIYRAKSIVQAATDAANLAAAKTLTITGNQSTARDAGQRIFAANLANLANMTNSITFNFGSGDCAVDGVIANAQINHNLFFSGVWRSIGTSSGQANIQARSIVNCGGDTIEIAFVIDNSSSMRVGGRIQAAKDATTRLVDTAHNIISGAASSNAIKFALVPFAALVNVGNTYRNQNWVDRLGKTSFHHEHFDWTTIGATQIAGVWRDVNDRLLTRFTLYDEMNQQWKGCFESREFPHHSRDTQPNQNNPQTLYVPSFAPDPPDQINDLNLFIFEGFFSLNYIEDHHNIPAQFGTGTNAIINTGTFGPPTTQIRRQNWMWKYLNSPRLYDVNNGFSTLPSGQHTEGGPNAYCTTQPITPLTNSRNGIKAAIRNMTPLGSTNIQQGIAWGWRVLSSREPFTQGRSETNTTNRKIMIIMSDGQNYLGENQINVGGNINPSLYGAFGFNGGINGNTILPKRLFNGVPGESQLRDTQQDNETAINYHMEQTCKNAKEDGIIIYSVAFRIAASQAGIKDYLRECASQIDLYYDANNNAELISVFEQISENLITLTISG